MFPRATLRAYHLTRSYASKARPTPRKAPPKPNPKPNPNHNPKSTPKPHSNVNPPSATPSTLPDVQCDEYQTLTLPDSRKLGYSTYGPSDAPVLLYFHGFPGSRFDARGVVSDARTRVIGIDRPGFGLSSFQPNRKLLDWPKDVQHLVKHLGIKSFRILGVSGGGPYAIACAHVFPRDVLKATGVLAGSAPVEAMKFAKSWRGASVKFESVERLMPFFRMVLRGITWWRAGRKINSSSAVVRLRTLRNMAAAMGYHGELDDDIVSSLGEPFRQGVNGYVEDALILHMSWGFQLEDVKAKNILLWYGDKDNNTPIEEGRYIVDRLEGGTLKGFPDETHFTLMENHGDEILTSLMKAGR